MPRSQPSTGNPFGSRPNEPIRLGSLNDADALEAMTVGLANEGHEVPEESAIALAAASQGFPQHIHGYLAGALSAIAEHGHLQPGAALTSALQTGHKHRDAYYDMTADKMAPDRSVIYPVVALMQRRNTTALPRRDAAQAVTESGDDGDAVVRQAIEHGSHALGLGGLFHELIPRRVGEDHSRIAIRHVEPAVGVDDALGIAVVRSQIEMGVPHRIAGGLIGEHGTPAKDVKQPVRSHSGPFETNAMRT